MPAERKPPKKASRERAAAEPRGADARSRRSKTPTKKRVRRKKGRVEGGPAARGFEIVKVYGSGDTRVRALAGLDVAFERGRFTAIMGPSGSGKSTLLHCMAGLDTVSSGRVYLGDIELTKLDEKRVTRLRRDRVGFVFQAFNLVPTLTAIENITLPMDIAGREPDPSWLDTIIDTVGLRDRLGHKPSQLSGGEQQRVAAARALASRPEVVFADEPTGNLDSRSGRQLLGFMRGAVDRFEQTIVMVTHDPVAASYADRVVFLRDGVVIDELAEPNRRKILDRLKRLEV